MTLRERLAALRAKRRRKAKAKRYKGYRGADRAAVIERLLREQGGLCAICLHPGCALGDGTVGLVLDHCHTSGKARAMLCTRCNAALGLMREDPDNIEVLRCYAEHFRGELQ